MNQRKLGRTQLQVSELGLNATRFEWAYDEATAFALLDAYHAEGGAFIQALGFCPSSAAAQPVENNSEDIVGRWHESRGIDRDRLVLASRISFFRPPHGGSIAFANRIRESTEHSLRRLRTPHLDLLICDWDDQLTPIDDVLEAIDQLIRAGCVRYAVAGGFPPWRAVDALHRANARNRARFEALQGEYSLMARARFEAEALAMCREHRLGFLARSPLAGGFLAQRPAPARPARGWIRFGRDWSVPCLGRGAGDAVLQVLAEIADRRRATPAQIALAWVLRNPQVTAALVSARTADELRDLMRATSLRLSPEETGALANLTALQDGRRGLPSA